MIINLTQHIASGEQIAAGVVEPADKELVRALLTFDALPTSGEINRRADDLVNAAMDTEVAYHGALASGNLQAMIGGAPYLMAPLERALQDAGIMPVYAYSKRESVEETQPDGSVSKRNVFRHVGFVTEED